MLARGHSSYYTTFYGPNHMWWIMLPAPSTFVLALMVYVKRYSIYCYKVIHHLGDWRRFTYSNLLASLSDIPLIPFNIFPLLSQTPANTPNSISNLDVFYGIERAKSKNHKYKVRDKPHDVEIFG